MLLFEFNARDLDRPLAEITEFVERFISQHQQDARRVGENERRGEERLRIAVPVITKPIEEDFQTSGETFVAVTKDISTRGIALFHHEEITSKYLAVRLTDRDGKRLTAVLEVLRCSPVGSFYETGGKFVTKLYDGLDRIVKTRS